MTQQKPRRALARFGIISAALCTLVGGYYLGQYWQRKPLEGLSAVVYPSARSLDVPKGLMTEQPGKAKSWRLYLPVDTRVAQCRDLIRHFGLVFNRLAAWPGIQDEMRLTLLAYDGDEKQIMDKAIAEAGWIDVVNADGATLNQIAGQLGILPSGDGWCSGYQANAILVDPTQRAWALLPYEEPAIMAQNISTIVSFVE